MRPLRSSLLSRTLLLLGALALCAVAVGCGDTDEAELEAPPVPPEPTQPGPVPTAPADAADSDGAVVAVSIEDVDGLFTEGFEVGLRFETGDGEVLEAILWSDVVAAQDPSTPEGFYDTVLEQPVPSGEVVVLGEVSVGIGPGPSVPDVEGALSCRVTVDLDPDERARIEVRFEPSDDCLHRVDA